MKSLNKVLISGHLGADPERNGAVKLSLAVHDSFATDAGTQTRTNWIPVVAFGKTGDFAVDYLRKGAHIIVEGTLRQNVWEPEPGKKQSRIEVIASTFIFLDKKTNGEQTELPSEAPAEAKTERKANTKKA